MNERSRVEGGRAGRRVNRAVMQRTQRGSQHEKRMNKVVVIIVATP